MQIGTIPQRWKNLDPDPHDQKLDEPTRAKRIQERATRIKKTKVCVLDYLIDGVKPHHLQSAEMLSKYLELENIDSNIKFRLFVVEDLSRDVLEILGHKLGIEPDFFRAHIVDYAWYNVRDRWRDPPNLDVVGRQKNWVQLRYVTARYFNSTEDFKAAVNDAKEFNILRRPDDDLSNKAWWDTPSAIVGLTRSRATIWLQSDHDKRTTAVGVLLLDPTVDKGFPIWRGRRNLYPTPEPGSDPAEWPKNLPPKPKSFYDDFLYWAQKPEIFSTSSGLVSNVHVPMQALLHLICSEWLTMSDYIKTRLSQIDVEIVKPAKFAPNNHIDTALERLHMWRRLIPLYREMISETLQQVFRFPCHTETFPNILPISSIVEKNEVAANGTTEETLAIHIIDTEVVEKGTLGDAYSKTYGDNVTQGTRPCSSETTSSDTSQKDPILLSPKGVQHTQLGSITAYRHDFLLALSYLEEYQKRIDRLTPVVTAVMGIEDSRRALVNAGNIGRLTWLATFFIPFSLVATTFCMQTKVTDMSLATVRLYFATSLPFAFVTIIVAWVLSHPLVQIRLSKMRV